MSEGHSPNEVMTPTYVGEQLVYVPLLIFYLGAEAIRNFIEETEND